MAKTISQAIRQKLIRFKLRFRGIRIHHHTVLVRTKFLGKATIEPFCRLSGYPLITIGDNFYMNADCHLLGEISIGNDVMIGPKTVIWGRDHGMAPDKPMRSQRHMSSPISIGNDVWIGANVTILRGVVIGDGAVVGAAAVVTRDIPSYAVAVGNPARVINFRHETKT